MCRINIRIVHKYEVGTAVCSRSVANQAYLTNYRSKKRKVIMHHTQGVWGSGAFLLPGCLRLRNSPGNRQRQENRADHVQ